MQLYKLTENYYNAITSLESMFEAGEVDAESMSDTLEGIEGELRDKAVNVALHIKNIRSDIEQLESAKASFDARIKRAKDQLEFFETYLDTNLQKSGIDEIKTDMVVVKYRKLPPVVEITGEVPEQYQRVIPEKREPDKRAIGDALKAGESLLFAELITGRQKLDIK